MSTAATETVTEFTDGHGRTYRVGMAVTNQRIHDAMPTGSQMSNGHSRVWEKDPDGYWHRVNGSARRWTVSTSGEFSISRIGPRVGGGIYETYLHNNEDFINLPVGVVIGPDGYEGERYLHNGGGDFVRAISDGMGGWVAGSDHRISSAAQGSFSRSGYNKVQWVPPEGYERRIETIALFRERFRQHALAGARRHGIDMGPVNRALRTLGLGEPTRFKNGATVTPDQFSSVDMRIPGLTLGIEGETWAEKKVMVLGENGEWTALIGDPIGRRTRATIISGGSDDGIDPGENGTEEDERAIAQFKSRAWRAGVAAKNRASWCGSFETVMAEFGITSASVLPNEGLYIEVSAEQAAQAPEGVCYFWTHEDGSWAVYQRTPSSSNRYGLTRVAGHSDSGRNLGNYQDRMQALTYGDEPSPAKGDAGVAHIERNSPLTRRMLFTIPGAIFDFGGSCFRVTHHQRAEAVELNRRLERCTEVRPLGVDTRGTYATGDFGDTQTMVVWHFPSAFDQHFADRRLARGQEMVADA